MIIYWEGIHIGSTPRLSNTWLCGYADNRKLGVNAMTTYEKVLESFKNYLDEDDTCEVLSTSRGYLVVDWTSGKEKSEWVTSRLCQTPEHLRDVLRSRYEEYQGFLLTNGYKRDVTSQEEQEIQRMGALLADLCDKK